VLGAWHAEIRRLSGLTRTFARTFLGGGFMAMASVDSAAAHLERAVELEPWYIYHHLELAEIYIDMERYADARARLTELRTLPHRDVLDTQHQAEAARLLEEIRNR
jgi:DNA-binding SARP family transcriptional activator